MTIDGRPGILVVNGDSAISLSISEHMKARGYRIVKSENGCTGLDALIKCRVDLVLLDLSAPGADGLEVLARLADISPDTPRIVLCGPDGAMSAKEALRNGASDCLCTPIEDFSVLDHAVNSALEKARLRKENQKIRRHLDSMVTERTRELKRANQRLRVVNTRLRGIVNSTRNLSICNDMDEFGSMLLSEFGEHMLANGGSLYLVEDQGLRMIHSLDKGRPLEFIPFPLDKGSLFQRVIAGGVPVLISDISDESDLGPIGWGDGETGSALAFPLSDELGKVTAILSLYSEASLPFINQDQEIGTILASYGGGALRAIKAAETLKESEQRFRSILDTIRAGIVIVAKGSRDILYANPTAAQMIGYEPKEIIGKECNNYLCSVGVGKCPVLDLGQEMESSENTLLGKDGQKIPILRTVTHTVYQGKPCLLESFVDLTAQKKADAEKRMLELQLRHSQKMEALGTLAGGIAHDFNNILSAVIGYTELCLLEQQEPDTPLRAKLNSILHASNRAKDLVSQILTFSRMQESRMNPISVSSVVKEALKLLQASLPADIRLIQHLTTDKHVVADPTQIHQVIINLCTNAYHAMEDGGGDLTVSLESISQAELEGIPRVSLPGGDYIRLTIEDTGCGIDHDIIERVFDPYFSTKDKDKGTGLGLSVVHGIVKSHGGAILVESSPGRGTKMHVILPATERLGGDDPGQKAASPIGSERILFIDDEEDLVDIACQALGELGYEVTGASGGLGALREIEKSPDKFDLVITDLSMPGMNGEKLAQRISAIKPDLPIIMCTGFYDPKVHKNPQKLGIRKVLLKPLAVFELAQSVREVLDNP
jgi:PAS domain S-box-containing protein